MALPALFHARLSVPAIAAPMFLVSGPALVLASCRAGVAGSFPALNARPVAQLDEWLGQLSASLGPQDAPYGVNLILHPTNTRLEEDLALIVKHRVPFVITSLGHPAKVVEAVHAYGGLVFADVIHAAHARKVAAAGVDGIIAVAAGAGGHAGTQSAFSLLREIREFWDGLLIAGGAISDGAGIRAAEVLGADLAYLGTRFIACAESMAQPAYKQMVVDCGPADIVYTDVISGANANFLMPSLLAAGYSKESLAPSGAKPVLKDLQDEAKVWRDMWSAGHGVASIHDQPDAATLCARLATEYAAACTLPASLGLRKP